MTLSPMMTQYLEIKENHKDCILFFRLGDFYEMFFDDAKTASKELELTLTGKNCGLEERAPMCGVPFHSSEGYIGKLVEKGYKVAVCEQIEEPATVKGLVKREVVQIITPGTITSGIEEKENVYIASIFIDKKGIGFTYCDITTGEISTTEFFSEDSYSNLTNELVRIDPKEIIINKGALSIIDINSLKEVFDSYYNELSDNFFLNQDINNSILDQFKAPSLIALGLEDKKHEIASLGGILYYLRDTQKSKMDHINILEIYQVGQHMSLDKTTIRNLELTETIYDKKIQGSLLGVLDKTSTAMGGRKIKKWLREPLNTLCEINDRLEGVSNLVNEYLLRNHIKECLKPIYDFERLCSRIANGNANGKDIIALKNSIYVLPELKLDLQDEKSELLRSLNSEIDSLEDIYKLIETSIINEPPFTVKEGGLIKDGFSTELDKLKYSIKDAKEWIASLERKERERTGIKNLKVGYNKVFGYYLEITKSFYDLIPENYIRKQTLANAERFITPELKEMEGLVLNAETKINNLEYSLFTDIKNAIKEHIPRIQKTSKAISTLDVLTSFAEVSSTLGYVKPEINNRKKIVIEKGRHPVIEQTIRNGVFVPNDTYIDKENASLLLITGPNMAGKSTYMRQTAIIVLMAQMGCFVPCKRAVIGICDRIFTRIGANDNLAQGQSTFFVEMSELAYILNSATEDSLIILDEIGRGTSTYDGLSIAWAVCEYLTKENHIIRTLFASHYHEITSMEGKLKGFKNLTVDVSEENGNIVFLHKIVEGSASRSYGIHVAQLAGVPMELLDEATLKLKELEGNDEKEEGLQVKFF